MKWQFTRVPCKHVVATIFNDNGRLHAYVEPLFFKETFSNAMNFRFS